MPDDVMTAAPVAPVAETPAVAAPAPSAPAADPVPTSAPVETAAPVAAPSEPAAAAEAAAPKPANEFQPSLLDAAAAPPDSAPKPDAAKEGTADAAKPAEAKTAAPGETPPAPVNYEFTYPEGVKPEDLNSERMSAYTGLLGESKIAPEVGQKLLDLHLAEIDQFGQRLAQRQWDIFNETQKTWRDEVMADPVLGGDNHGQSIKTIMSLVEQYGGNAQERQGLLDAFRITGAANNPHVLRFMHRAARALAVEATPHAAPPPRAPAPTGRDRSLSRYANTTPVQPGR